MFEGKNLLQILTMGGGTILVLLLCLVLSLAVILERVVYFRKNSKVKRVDFIKKIAVELEKKDLNKASLICDNTGTHFARVAKAGLEAADKGEAIIGNSMERRIGFEINNLERYTSILGSIGSTVVYIGLFGTVIGIIRAFQDIALTAGGTGGGMGMVIAGIAEALVSTASGICVAVPAVIAYNLLQKSIGNHTMDMELCASEISDLLRSE